MPPNLKLYEPPLDDGEDDETPAIPCLDSHASTYFVFAVLAMIGGSAAALLWTLAALFSP